MPDGYMDAAAVPVPDAGDDTLREQLTWELIEHCSIPRYHEDGTENWQLAYCPTCGAEGLYGPNSPDHARHQADALLPRIREHIAAAVQGERERVERYQSLDAIHMRDQLRMIHAVGEALGIDQNDADACVPGCDEGAGGLEHDLHHLIERIKRLREVHVPSEGEDFAFCDACDRIWPCQTVSILDGTEAADGTR